MRLALVAPVLLALALPAVARAQASESFQSQDVADLEQRVASLEARVSQLEARPGAQAASSEDRAQTFDAAVQRLAGLREALEVGQSDVVASLRALERSVRASAEQLGAADQTERAHAQAALAAMAADEDDVGREDLWQARSALVLAQLELGRARDLALVR